MYISKMLQETVKIMYARIEQLEKKMSTVIRHLLFQPKPYMSHNFYKTESLTPRIY